MPSKRAKRRQIATTREGGCRSCKSYLQWLERRAKVMVERIPKADKPRIELMVQLHAFMQTAVEYEKHLARHEVEQELVRP